MPGSPIDCELCAIHHTVSLEHDDLLTIYPNVNTTHQINDNAQFVISDRGNVSLVVTAGPGHIKRYLYRKTKPTGSSSRCVYKNETGDLVTRQRASNGNLVERVVVSSSTVANLDAIIDTLKCELRRKLASIPHDKDFGLDWGNRSDMRKDILIRLASLFLASSGDDDVPVATTASARYIVTNYPLLAPCGWKAKVEFHGAGIPWFLNNNAAEDTIDILSRYVGSLCTDEDIIRLRTPPLHGD